MLKAAKNEKRLDKEENLMGFKKRAYNGKKRTRKKRP